MKASELMDEIKAWREINDLTAEQAEDLRLEAVTTRRPIDVILQKRENLLWGDNSMREAIFANIR